MHFDNKLYSSTVCLFWISAFTNLPNSLILSSRIIVRVSDEFEISFNDSILVGGELDYKKIIDI